MIYIIFLYQNEGEIFYIILGVFTFLVNSGSF